MLKRRKRLRLKTGRDLARHAGLHLPVEFFLEFSVGHDDIASFNYGLD
jgi:hypothetical protein